MSISGEPGSETAEYFMAKNTNQPDRGKVGAGNERESEFFIREQNLITDFSHYLTAGQANIRDEETLKAINDFNYSSLFSFDSDHLDSPGSIAVLLMTMQNIGKTKQEVIYHANSAAIRPDLDSFTTSYFSMFFH